MHAHASPLEQLLGEVDTVGEARACVAPKPRAATTSPPKRPRPRARVGRIMWDLRWKWGGAGLVRGPEARGRGGESAEGAAAERACRMDHVGPPLEVGGRRPGQGAPRQ